MEQPGCQLPEQVDPQTGDRCTQPSLVPVRLQDCSPSPRPGTKDSPLQDAWGRGEGGLGRMVRSSNGMSLGAARPSQGGTALQRRLGCAALLCFWGQEKANTDGKPSSLCRRLAIRSLGFGKRAGDGG